MLRFLIAPFFILLGGCATMVNGTTQQITITSIPVGAEVIIDGHPRGRTPAIVELERDADHMIAVKQPGFEERDYPLKSSVSGWIWGNIPLIYAGMVGVFVDFFNGSAYRLKPDAIAAELPHQPN